MTRLSFLWLAACAGEIVVDDTSSDTGTDASGDTDPADTDPASADGCWEADTLLDVSTAPGAGDGYAAPELAGSCSDTTFSVTSNAIPHYTFVAMTPNELVEGDFAWEIPRSPSVASSTTEIPLLGTVGFAVNGGPIFGPNEAAQPPAQAWGDPVYNGIMDGCLGHTAFAYHFHALLQKCLTPEGLVATPWTLPDVDTTEPSPVLGWALDGFPIHGPQGCLDQACTQVVTFESGWEQTGDPVRDAWDNHAYVGGTAPEVLDECNGRVGPDGTYRYHATATFPYVLGCYAGEPVDAGPPGGGPP